MSLLSRDQILGAQDLPVEEVEVPEWGGAVRVRGLTGSEKDQWEAEWLQFDEKGQIKERDSRDFRAKLLVRCIVDQEGKRIFEDKDAQDLGAKSGIAVDRVFLVAERLSALSQKSQQALERNFGAGQR